MSKIIRSMIDEQAGVPLEIQEQVKKNLEGREIDYSDIPAMNPAEVREAFQEYKVKHQKRKILFSLRLKKETIDWWKASVGDGYTTVMAEVLDQISKSPELQKKFLE